MAKKKAEQSERLTLEANGADKSSSRETATDYVATQARNAITGHYITRNSTGKFLVSRRAVKGVKVNNAIPAAAPNPAIDKKMAERVEKAMVELFNEQLAD